MVATPLLMLPSVDEAERERHERRLERDRRRREQGKATFFEGDPAPDTPVVAHEPADAPTSIIGRRDLDLPLEEPPIEGELPRGPARARAIRRHLRGRDRPVADRRAGPGDRPGGGVRDLRPGQRVRDRVPHPEHGPRARRGLGALGRVRPGLQRPARQGERQRAWRVASSMFWLMLLGLGGLTALFVVIAPWVMAIFHYGPGTSTPCSRPGSRASSSRSCSCSG